MMKRNLPIAVRRLFAPTSLRFQLLSRSLIILAGLLLLIGVLQFAYMQHFLYKNQAVSIRSQIPPILNLVRAHNGDFFRENPRGDWGRPGGSIVPALAIPDMTVAFVSADGAFHELYADNERIPAPRLAQQFYHEALAKTQPELIYRVVNNSRGGKQLVVLQPIRNHVQLLGVLQVGTSVKRLQDVLFRQLIVFLLLSVFALLTGLFVFQRILRRTLVPLSNVVNTVERINAGNLHERLDMQQGQTEMNRLAASINDMLGRLERSFAAEKQAKEQMSRFIADASHELRTPLTSIHGFLEVLLRGAAANPEQLQKSLSSMYGESERINKLVEDLLLLAQLDRTPALRMETGRLDDVLHEMEPQLRLLAKDRIVRFSVAADTAVRFDRNKMKQVILNLFHNAVQHTDPIAGEIVVRLEEQSAHLALAIADNGPGIPAEHAAHLFERFYRADASRARKYGGAGLGLAITKSIVDLHGGTIQVDSQQGKGAVFTVSLPVQRDVQAPPLEH